MFITQCDTYGGVSEGEKRYPGQVRRVRKSFLQVMMLKLCLRDVLGQPTEGGEGVDWATGFPDGGRHSGECLYTHQVW